MRRLRGAADYALLAEALAALAFASMAIRLVAFRRVAAFASRPPRIARHDANVARLRWAVRAWARRVPWRAVCFQTALALQLLLRRRGVAGVMHYGVGRGEDELKAHVWLSVDGDTILGGDEAPRFTEIATFPPRRPQ